MKKPYRPENKNPDIKYHPDTFTRIAQTVQPYSEKLSRLFRERIAMLKGRRR